jgi:hypothetical protein
MRVAFDAPFAMKLALAAGFANAIFRVCAAVQG